MSNELTVQSLTINKQYPYKASDPYQCTVEIKGEYQDMKLKLPAETSGAIIDLIAEQIVEGSRMVANGLTRTALNHKALEHNPDEINGSTVSDEGEDSA